MEYAYAQAGQENSFTWDAMSKGFEIQMPLIAKLRDANKIKVETLAESGQWFRDHYKVTPATSVTINQDLPGSDEKTVWFNSRFYRANLLWEHGALRFRDIHLFNENVPSVYEKNKATSNECSFFTLPVVDGYLWSTPTEIAGLRFKAIVDGKETGREGGKPASRNPVPGTLHIAWPLKSFDGTLEMDFDERQVRIRLESKMASKWFLDLSTAKDAKLPFKKIGPKRIDGAFEGMNFTVTAAPGLFSKPSENVVFRVTPVNNQITLNLDGTK